MKKFVKVLLAILALEVAVGGGAIAAAATNSVTAATPVYTPAPFTPVAPARILDTRYSSGPLHSNGTLKITVDPSLYTATAVVLNVTAVDQTDAGYLSVTADGSHATSTVNWNSAHYTTANEAVVALNTNDHSFTIYNFQGDTDVVIDFLGYFAP